MNPIMKEFKEELKTLAVEIHNYKKERKTHKCGYLPGLIEMKYEYRHWHIAYCELRGTPREMIEQPAEENQPSESFIQHVKDVWSKKYAEYEQTLRVAA